MVPEGSRTGIGCPRVATGTIIDDTARFVITVGNQSAKAMTIRGRKWVADQSVRSESVLITLLMLVIFQF
jgi:hypothetical protein